MGGDRRLLVLATTAGIVLAAVVTFLQDSTYRADASVVLVRAGQPPGSDAALSRAAESAEELFDSRAVAESALRNLGLDESPDELLDRVDVDARAGSSLVRIEVEAPSAEEARRTAQELSEVSTVLFNDRFSPQTVASVWERASADGDRVSPKPVRNLALGALLGALAGWALLLRGRDSPAPRSRPVPETAPQPAARAAAVVEPPAGPEPAAAAEPPPPAAGPFRLPGFGEWTVADVERLLTEQGPAFPERSEELETYLHSFRAVADADGRLGGDVDLVIEDVFAELISRSGAARRD
ncbi:MAG: YveK family protein [Gaiellaceae bacterium]